MTGTHHSPDPALPPPGATKADWRRWARASRRTGVPEAVSQSVTAGIIGWLADARTPEGMVVLYFPLPDEADVTSVMESADRAFAVTRTPSRGSLTLHLADSPRERHRYGFEQPVADAPLVDPGDVGVVLVPGLAFDRQGGRLGRGAGYYDRFLPTFPAATCRVGIAPGQLVVKVLPTDPHDVPMTHLATENGVRSAVTRYTHGQVRPI